MIWFLERLIIAAITAFYGYQIFRAWRVGECNFRGAARERDEPILFWINVVGSVVVVIVGVCLLLQPDWGTTAL